MDRSDPETGKLGNRTEHEAITAWLTDIKSGDRDAPERLWKHYKIRLTALARVRLSSRIRRVFDENDLASVAFQGFLTSAKSGDCDHVRNRDDLWRLLAVITSNRARDRADFENAAKRGSGQVRGESIFLKEMPEPLRPGAGLDGISGTEIEPDLMLAIIDHAQGFLASLEDETLRSVAVLKLQGYTNPEIAKQLSMGTRSVERKISLVKRLWSDLDREADDPAET